MNWINPQAIAVDKSANARMVTIYKKIHGLFKLGMGRHVPSISLQNYLSCQTIIPENSLQWGNLTITIIWLFLLQIIHLKNTQYYQYSSNTATLERKTHMNNSSIVITILLQLLLMMVSSKKRIVRRREKHTVCLSFDHPKSGEARHARQREKLLACWICGLSEYHVEPKTMLKIVKTLFRYRLIEPNSNGSFHKWRFPKMVGF